MFLMSEDGFSCGNDENVRSIQLLGKTGRKQHDSQQYSPFFTAFLHLFVKKCKNMACFS